LATVKKNMQKAHTKSLNPRLNVKQQFGRTNWSYKCAYTTAQLQYTAQNNSESFPHILQTIIAALIVSMGREVAITQNTLGDK